MVLMAGYLILLEWQMNKLAWGEGEDGNDPGWDENEDEFFVYGNVTWVGQDRVMDRPIVVATGGSLRLLDCSIGFDIEDLARWRNSPAVDVEMGATFALEDSELYIDADPLLDKALINDESDSWDHPYLHRVVNLEGTNEPYLRFDLEWRLGDTYVAVAAEAAPGEEPVLLEVLRSSESSLGDWVHVNIPLTDFAGGQPRIMIFLGNVTQRDVLLANVTVMDRDGPLPGDIPFTGNPKEDGWGGYGFQSFYSYVEDRSLIPLVEAMGDLSFVRSTVRAIEGLPRWSRGTHYIILEAVDPSVGPANLMGASLGAEVNVWGADLEIRDSTFLYVPVIGSDCPVDVVRSTFRGDADLITIGNVRGEVRDCVFNFTKPGVDRGQRSTVGTPWALSLNGQWDLGYMPVTGCVFTGGGGWGLLLNDVRIDLDGCSFEGLRLAIWDHESDLRGGWDDLNASNDFGPWCSYWYIETHVMTVLFLGRDRPLRRTPAWDSTYFEEDLNLPHRMPVFTDEVNGVICVPTHIASRRYGHVAPQALSLEVDLRWARDRVFEFDVASTSIVVNLDEIDSIDPKPDYEVDTTIELSPGNTSGQVHMEVTCDFYGSSYEFPTFYVTLDGVIVETVDMLDPTYYWDYQGVHIPYNLTVSPGSHEVEISLMALHVFLNQSVEVYNWTATVFRADGNVGHPNMSNLMSSGVGVILLDPGVTVEGGELIGPVNEDFNWPPEMLYVMAGNDSVLTFDTLNSSWFYLYFYGPGEMHILQTIGEWHSYNAYGGRLILGGVSSYVSLNGFGTDLTLRGLQGFFSIELYSPLSGNITIEDCQPDEEGAIYLDTSGGNVTVRNCTFTSGYAVGLTLVVDHHTSLDIRDCVFSRTYLSIWTRPEIDWSLNLTDCIFEGPECYFTLVGSVNYQYYRYHSYTFYEVTPPGGDGIWNNTFGSGTTAIIADGAREDILGDNELEDGVAVLAVLGPEAVYEGEIYGSAHGYRILTCVGGTLEWPYEQSSYNEMNKVLVNVTSDARGPVDDVYVDVMVATFDYNRFSNLGTIIGFATVRYNLDEIVFNLPDWTLIGTVIETIADNVIIEDNWWTD